MELALIIILAVYAVAATYTALWWRDRWKADQPFLNKVVASIRVAADVDVDLSDVSEPAVDWLLFCFKAAPPANEKQRRFVQALRKRKEELR